MLHHDSSGPLLIRVGNAARDWANRPAVTPRSAVPLFLAAAKVARGRSPCPSGAAPEPRHCRLELRAGPPWMTEFLDCVAAAAKIGLLSRETSGAATTTGRDSLILAFAAARCGRCRPA